MKCLMIILAFCGLSAAYLGAYEQHNNGQYEKRQNQVESSASINLSEHNTSWNRFGGGGGGGRGGWGRGGGGGRGGFGGGRLGPGGWGRGGFWERQVVTRPVYYGDPPPYEPFDEPFIGGPDVQPRSQYPQAPANQSVPQTPVVDAPAQIDSQQVAPQQGGQQ